jgi:hypothetical protein
LEGATDNGWQKCWKERCVENEVMKAGEERRREREEVGRKSGRLLYPF